MILRGVCIADKLFGGEFERGFLTKTTFSPKVNNKNFDSELNEYLTNPSSGQLPNRMCLAKFKLNEISSTKEEITPVLEIPEKPREMPSMPPKGINMKPEVEPPLRKIDSSVVVSDESRAIDMRSYAAESMRNKLRKLKKNLSSSVYRVVGVNKIELRSMRGQVAEQMIEFEEFHQDGSRSNHPQNSSRLLNNRHSGFENDSPVRLLEQGEEEYGAESRRVLKKGSRNVGKRVRQPKAGLSCCNPDDGDVPNTITVHHEARNEMVGIRVVRPTESQNLDGSVKNLSIDAPRRDEDQNPENRIREARDFPSVDEEDEEEEDQNHSLVKEVTELKNAIGKREEKINQSFPNQLTNEEKIDGVFLTVSGATNLQQKSKKN